MSEFTSGSRSTLPLLDFWRDHERALADYRRVLGVQLTNASLSFEHQTPVQRGRGKASHTDLMIDTSDEAIAVEAKFTEPQYELVSEWKGEQPNRTEVLGGWLSLISKVTGADVTVQAVTSIPYQMVHRAASACSMGRDVSYVVYHLFGSGELTPYAKHLRTLSEACGRSRRLELSSFKLQSGQFHNLPTFSLVQNWPQNSAR
jgi:hypothetical protein